MAEEVKIVDVAGGPAAEATLQELLKVMKAGGGSGGGGGKSAESASIAQEGTINGNKLFFCPLRGQKGGGGWLELRGHVHFTHFYALPYIFNP